MQRFNQTTGLWILLLLAAGMLGGCGTFKPAANEGESMVVIAVEDGVRRMTEDLVSELFRDELMTPLAEPRYQLRFASDDSLGFVTRWPNVLLLGTLDGSDAISQRIARMLDSEAEAQVRAGDTRVFRQRDVWARGQTVVVATAPTINELAVWLRENGEVMVDLLAEDRRARMHKRIYSSYEQTELADSLREEHGWSLRIPHDYLLTSSKRDPSFVRLRRMYPDRFITIGWRPGSADSLSAETLVRWRDELGLTYPDSSRTNTMVLDSAWTTLGGVQALEVHGIWETYGPLGGGPYVAYLLHKNGTLYLVDGKVFAPDRDKEPFIRHLEVVLATFEP